MRLNQVTAPARDLSLSVAFYQMLGLKLIVRTDAYARFVCPDGGSTFSLHLDDDAGNPSRVTVYFEDDDLDGLVARLKAKGLAFESDPVDQRWLWREAYLRDPAGNQICLYKAGDMRLNPPWRLKDGDDTA